MCKLHSINELLAVLLGCSILYGMSFASYVITFEKFLIRTSLMRWLCMKNLLIRYRLKTIPAWKRFQYQLKTVFHNTNKLIQYAIPFFWRGFFYAAYLRKCGCSSILIFNFNVYLLRQHGPLKKLPVFLLSSNSSPKILLRMRLYQAPENNSGVRVGVQNPLVVNL